MSAIYTQVHDAALAAVQAIPLVVSRQLRVTRRKQPKFVPLLDTMTQVIVACRVGLATRTFELHFGNQATLIFDIYVGFFVDDRPADHTQSDQRAQFREDTRLALWEPVVLALSGIGEFDVEYDPSGGDADNSLPDNVDGSWQLFSYYLRTARSG